jgi:hypothetical protein
MKFNGFFQTATAFMFAILLNSCSFEDFNRHYQQLDSDDIRPFSYQFRNPEIAPGDTVELLVFFSGKKVKLENISWKVNWNYITNRFGSSAPVNGFERQLEVTDKRIVDADHGHSQIATIKFVVPDSMLYESYAIPESLEHMSSLYNFPNIPKIDFPTSKKSILNMFENLAKCPPYLQQAIIDSLGINGKVIDGLAQIFSAMFEIYIEIPNTPRSKIRHTVRYHGKLSGMRGVYYNRNPIFDIYFSQGNRGYYICYVNEYGFQRSQTDTIKISLTKNKTASLDFYSKNRDYAISLEKAFSPTGQYVVKWEDFYTKCFVEGETYSKLWLSSFSTQETQPPYNEDNLVFNKSDYFTKIININYDKARPGDKGYLFLVLLDELDDVIYRPQGRTTLGFPIEFVD